ncbi:MAG: MFS transporter [Lentisphaerae bacterium]|nr:MFS transporter [Lentisphaerota bacterium]
MQKLIFGRYDYAAFLTFIAYAAGSVIFPVVMPDLAHDLNFPLNDGGMGAAGALHFVRSGAMVVSMACSGFLAARFGLRETILPGLFLMSGAVAAAVFAPNYAFLIVVMLFAGMGEGALEALATPFVQELHRDNEPGRYVNFSHGFWSVGVALATVGAGVMLNCRIPWQVALLTVALCGVPGIVLLFLPSKSEQRKLENAKGQSTAEVFANTVKIFRNGRFWLYFIAIFFAGGGEWCLTFWTPSFIRLVHGGSALVSGMAMALFAFGMVAGRMLSGMFVPQKYLPQLLVGCGTFSIVAGILVPFAPNIWSVCVLITLCGVSVGPFWPSIQSVCVDKLKLDSTLTYIILSCAGIPGCGIFTWLQGALGDVEFIGLRYSFFLMPLSVLLMTVLLLAAVSGKKKIIA